MTSIGTNGERFNINSGNPENVFKSTAPTTRGLTGLYTLTFSGLDNFGETIYARSYVKVQKDGETHFIYSDIASCNNPLRFIPYFRSSSVKKPPSRSRAVKLSIYYHTILCIVPAIFNKVRMSTSILITMCYRIHTKRHYKATPCARYLFISLYSRFFSSIFILTGDNS